MSALPDVEFVRPDSLAEAVAAHGGSAEAVYVAGGTDLLVNLRRGIDPGATRLVDLSAVAELGGIDRAPDGGLRIGAGVTLARLAADAAVRQSWPAIAEAAAVVAGPTHRAMATLGGNLCLDTRCMHFNKSEWWRRSNDYCLKYKGDVCRVVPTSDRCHAVFAGDVAPALMVLGAEVELAGPGGARRLPLAEMYREDGAAHLALEPGEILAAVHVPAAPGLRAGYAKTRVRDAVDFPLVGVAAALRREGDALVDLRVAATATNSCPVLIEGLEAFRGRPLDADALAGIGALLRKRLNPLKTTTVTPRYRRRVAVGTLRRLLEGLWT